MIAIAMSIISGYPYRVHLLARRAALCAGSANEEQNEQQGTKSAALKQSASKAVHVLDKQVAS